MNTRLGRYCFVLGSLLAAISGCTSGAIPATGTPPHIAPSAPATETAAVSGPADITPTPPLSGLLLAENTPFAAPVPATGIPFSIPSLLVKTDPNLLAGIEISRSYFAGGLRRIAESGAYWTRRNGLIWSVVEPAEGTYDWGSVASLENEMETASIYQLELILVVRGAPFWAQGIPGYPCGPIKPEKMSAFGDFLYEAVSRYSVPPFNVKYWEIWNEPDAGWTSVNGASPFGCWGDSRDPYFGGSVYGDMLKSIYPRMKEANPDIQVLVGGLLLDCDPRILIKFLPGSDDLKFCSSGRFLDGILKTGGGDFFDGVSFHAYDYYYGSLGDYRNPNWNSAWDTSGPALIAKSRFLQEVLDRYGRSDKYLMNTEVALLCGRTGDEPACQRQDFQDTKTYYLAQSYAAAHAVGLRANIWFSLLGWRASGLVSIGSLLPSRTYQAFVASKSFLEATSFQGEVDMYPGVWGFRFRRDDDEIWILWSIDGLSHHLDLPRLPAAAYDVLGAPIQPLQEIEVNLSPLWLIFSESPA
jgi:hypothetical protein